MDDCRFDVLVQVVAKAQNRRTMLRSVAGVVAGGLLARPAGGDAAAICRGPGRLCREDANCCAHSFCDHGPYRRCACDPGYTACGGACVDVLTDVDNCGACKNVCPDEQCRTTVCAGGICGTVPDPAQNGFVCDDGDLCTTGDVCQAGACSGTPVDCSGFVDACHSSACDPATGTCLTQTFGDGTSCVSANPCAVDPTCQAGVCTPASLIQCLVCNECSGGACAPVADGTSCGQDAVCVGGSCTLIQCLACSHLEGISCVPDADGTSCGQDSVCVNGNCQLIQCLACSHLEGISCVPDADGTPCGPNLECMGGNCVPA